jgi:small subunit ribosomal protein S21
MPSVRLRDNEPFEVAPAASSAGCDREDRSTHRASRPPEFYESRTAERKRKLAAAVKRHYKRLRSQQLPPEALLDAAARLYQPEGRS